MVLASPIYLTVLLKEKEVEKANAGGIKQAQKGRDQAKATTSTTVLHVEGKGTDWQVRLTLTRQLLCIYASTLHPQLGFQQNKIRQVDAKITNLPNITPAKIFCMYMNIANCHN